MGDALHTLSLSLQFRFTEKPVPLQFEPFRQLKGRSVTKIDLSFLDMISI